MTRDSCPGHLDRLLAMPADHQRFHGADVPQREVDDAMRQQPQPEDPAAQRGRLGFQRGAVQRVCAAEPFRRPVRLRGKPIEQLGVVAQQLCSPGQGFGNAGPKLGLQRGQHGFAYAHSRKPAICVVGVLPRVESLLRTGLLGRFTADVKEWPQ